jgi:hypothetical protein
VSPVLRAAVAPHRAAGRAAAGRCASSLRRLAVAASFGSGAALVLGCGGNPDDNASASPTSVLLGSGEAAFEAMEGEPTLRLVRGAQGGFHVWASVLAYGFSSPRLDLRLTTTVDDEPESSLVMRARLTMRDVLDPEGNPAQSFAGFPAQVKGARCAHGRRVGIELQLSQPGGGSSRDVRYCIAEVDEASRSADCP